MATIKLDYFALEFKGIANPTSCLMWILAAAAARE